MQSVRTFGLVLIFLSMAALPCRAETKLFQSAVEKTQTIELFTSEGCSSCPPADDWLNRLDKKQGLWTRWIPMAFHVDYWDYLGWKDPWSKREFTDRQRAYAAVWDGSSIYTPGMVLNGEEWRDWHRFPTPPNLSNAPKPGKLKAEADDAGRIRIEFSPNETSKGGVSFLAHAAILGFDQVSKVKAGENSGRTLTHHFNVLEHAEAPMRRSNGVFEAQLNIPALSKSRDSRGAFAVWVSSGEDPAPVQAAGGEW